MIRNTVIYTYKIPYLSHHSLNYDCFELHIYSCIMIPLNCTYILRANNQYSGMTKVDENECQVTDKKRSLILFKSSNKSSHEGKLVCNGTHEGNVFIITCTHKGASELFKSSFPPDSACGRKPLTFSESGNEDHIPHLVNITHDIL